MFIEVGKRVINLSHVKSVDLSVEGEAALVVDVADLEDPDPQAVARVLRLEGEAAKAVRRYFEGRMGATSPGVERVYDPD